MLQNGESSHVLRIFDEEAQAMQSARNSSRMLEESYATGVAILAQYAGQRDRLKVSVLRQLPYIAACKHICIYTCAYLSITLLCVMLSASIARSLP